MRICLALCALLLIGCNGRPVDMKYRAVDAQGRYYCPWNAEPYKEDAHWMDRHVWYQDEAEIERMKAWQEANPPSGLADRMMR